MYNLTTVTPETAKDEAKEVFDWFADKPFDIPRSFEIAALSPKLAKKSLEVATYFGAHETLSFPLLTSIRYAVSCAVCLDSCVALNGDILKKCGMTEDDLEAVANKQEETPLEAHEEVLLKFVVQRVTNPEAGCTEAEIDAVRSHGWTDQDIYEATYHGFFVLTPAMIERSLSS